MHFFRKLASRFFKNNFISGLYECREGIKTYNQLLSSEKFDGFVGGDRLNIQCRELRLPPDFLNDAHTLLGTPIDQSPFSRLVASVHANESLATSDYVYRRTSGTLDFMPARKLDGSDLNKLEEVCRTQTARIEGGDYEPIKLVLLAGKYYIFDGKHRAATCAYLQRDVLCVDITKVIYDSFYWWIRERMLRSSARYTRHLILFDQIEDMMKSS